MLNMNVIDINGMNHESFYYFIIRTKINYIT